MQVPRQVVMTASTLDQRRTGEDVSKLSKSQKKRRKRKAAKGGTTVTAEESAPNKPVEESAAAVPATAPKASSVTLNPMAKVHDRLMEEGYSDKEVEKAMNEMWEKEMTGYDDYDAVLAYLRGTNEAQDESTAPSTAPSMTLDEPSLNGHVYEEAVEEEKEEIEDASISTASSQHLDMAARLDMVAESEGLGDSAYALNKWITEKAKQSELEGFCSGNKSRALFTVFRRSIEEPSDADVRYVLTMVSSIFLKAGMDSLSASEMKGNLRLVFQQARTAYSKNKAEQDFLAENIANALVTRISGLVQDLLSRQDTESPKTIRDLEQEINALSTSLNTLGQCGIVELVQNRDVQKAAKDKALEVVDIAMGTLSNDKASTVQVSAVTKDEVLLSLVGEDGLEKMNANKLAHDAMRQKVKDAEERSSPEYQALKMNLSTFQGERSLIMEKMEELKNTLKQLEDEDAMLCGKIEATQKEIAALDESSSGEMAKLQADLAKTSKAAESDVSVRTLADRLALYETSVKRCVNSASLVASGDGDMSNIVPEKVNSYLIRARYYFRSEADCVQFLRSRVRNLETEANSMNNELEELMSLGLSSNAKQLEGQLNEKIDSIKEDNQAIEQLCLEAAKTRDEIADKLELCGADLSSLNMSVLRGIVSAMAEMEVDIGRLSQFVESSNGYASKSPQAMNGGSPVHSQNKAAAIDATPAQLATKLTWASNNNKGTDGEAKKTTSLLNIQKEEELSSKE